LDGIGPQFAARETALTMSLSALDLHLAPSLVVLDIGGNRNVTGALANVDWFQMAALRELYLDQTGANLRQHTQLHLCSHTKRSYLH
jgi:hypothetical protein